MKEDMSFSKDKNDNIIIAKDKIYVRNTIHQLFAMTTGFDEYDNDKGLDLKSKRYASEEKLAGYERDIYDQFQKYTDLLISNVTVTLKDSVVTIFMSVMYNSVYYNVLIGSSSNDLSIMIE